MATYATWVPTTTTWTTTDTWNYWTTTSATTIQDQVWADWTRELTVVAENTTAAVRQVRTAMQPVAAAVREVNQAQLDRQQAARELYARQRLAERERLAGAQERAMELLLGLLTPEERAHHDRHDEFLVTGQSGRRYVIQKHGVHGNLKEVDEHGCVLGRICVAPGMYDGAGAALPLADGWVGQYLALKHEEERLREVGNWSYQTPCVRTRRPRNNGLLNDLAPVAA